MSVKQITTQDVKEIVGKTVAEIVDRRLAEIETKLRDTTGAMIDDRLQSLDLPRRPGNTEILETVRSSFDDMDFVREVHYGDSDGELRLVIIHDHLPSVSAFSAICSRVLDMEDSLDDPNIETMILHESEVLPRHMKGSKVLFKRPRDAAGLHGDNQQSREPKNPHDRETLEIVRNSFDDLDFVREVHYLHDDGKLKLVIIHGSERLGSACSSICNRIVKTEDLLNGMHIRNLILHESEDTSLYLDGAKVLFRR